MKEREYYKTFEKSDTQKGRLLFRLGDTAGASQPKPSDYIFFSKEYVGFIEIKKVDCVKKVGEKLNRYGMEGDNLSIYTYLNSILTNSQLKALTKVLSNEYKLSNLAYIVHFFSVTEKGKVQTFEFILEDQTIKQGGK